ncbi:hypothetical protein SAMN05216374_0913 [Tardiphaga sp. OK246]|nr:hypothetical protein SAMN05216374_0913 [Tardiphaga sp. OK246]
MAPTTHEGYRVDKYADLLTPKFDETPYPAPHPNPLPAQSGEREQSQALISSTPHHSAMNSASAVVVFFKEGRLTPSSKPWTPREMQP